MVIKLLERLSRSKLGRAQKARGKFESWFDARCTSLRKVIMPHDITNIQLPQHCQPVKRCRNSAEVIEAQSEVGETWKCAPEPGFDE